MACPHGRLVYCPDCIENRDCEDQLRDDLGQFAGCGGGGGGSSSDSSSGGGGGVAAGAVAAAKAGGGTLDPKTGTPLEPGQPGYVVAMPGHSGILPADQFFTNDAQAAQAVRSWMDANAQVLSQPGMNVGVWHDAANGEVVLDPSEVISDKSAAISAGIARDQQAIWDNGAMQEIPTGGTGGRAQTYPASTREAGEALLRDVGGGEGRAGPPPGAAEQGSQGRLPGLPARRRRLAQQRKKGPDPKDGDVVVFDYDGTITGAPKFMTLVARGLKAMGCHIVVLTGNVSTRSVLTKALDDFGFPYDDLVQYHDDGTDGVSRAEHLKQFGAIAAFDNRVDRAIVLGKVCPHAYIIAEPSKDEKHQAKKDDAKKAAKQVAKQIGLRALRPEARGAPRIPPNYELGRGTPETHCGNCDMFWQGYCWGYGNVRVDAEQGKCDEWTPEEPSGEATP